MSHIDWSSISNVFSQPIPYAVRLYVEHALLKSNGSS